MPNVIYYFKDYILRFNTLGCYKFPDLVCNSLLDIYKYFGQNATRDLTIDEALIEIHRGLSQDQRMYIFKYFYSQGLLSREATQIMKVTLEGKK